MKSTRTVQIGCLDMIEKNKFTNLQISPSDRQTLRELAIQVAELAVQPSEDDKRALWYRHNALRPTHPLIFCDPENGWFEIITPEHLICQNLLARHWEFRLRMEIFWGKEMLDDRVIEPFFEVPHSYSDTGWGMQEKIIGGEQGGAYMWDSPLKDYKDLGSLHFPQILIDEQQTLQILDIAHDLFDGILTVRQKTNWWWSLGMTRTLINLRGLTQIMYDMTDRPEYVHQLMAFLRDGTLAMLDFLEQNRLLYLNNDGAYVGSGGFGWSDELPQQDFNGKVRLKDMWGFSESQETVGISPHMFDEFIFSYQMPILQRFGLNCYGCCEPVDKRWASLSTIPNLRRISISPWSNLEEMADRLSTDYILSMKPHPGDLADETFEEDHIRAGLRKALRITRDCRVEVVMKDNNTIRNDPRRVIRWVKIAKEEANRL